MKVVSALIAGVCGSLAMSAAMLCLRLLGVNVSLEALLGSMFANSIPGSPFLIGFLIHVTVGALVGLGYAAIFEFAIQRAGVLAGAGLGLSHGLMTGLVMSGIPAMNPLGSAGQAGPGVFLQNLEFGPLLFIALHVPYGAVAGAAYGHPLQSPHLYTNRTAH